VNETNPNKINQTTCTQLSFNDFKKSLGKESTKYSDGQIEQIRVSFDKMADIFFDDWLYRRNAHNVVTGKD
jgi:hypothetical protein